MTSTDDEGGDPACWLDHVCDSCGRFVADAAAHQCDAPADAQVASRPAS